MSHYFKFFCHSYQYKNNNQYDENCTLFKIKFQVELKPKCEKQSTISKLPLEAYKCNIGIEILKTSNKNFIGQNIDIFWQNKL